MSRIAPPWRFLDIGGMHLFENHGRRRVVLGARKSELVTCDESGILVPICDSQLIRVIELAPDMLATLQLLVRSQEPENGHDDRVTEFQRALAGAKSIVARIEAATEAKP